MPLGRCVGSCARRQWCGSRCLRVATVWRCALRSRRPRAPHRSQPRDVSGAILASVLQPGQDRRCGIVVVFGWGGGDTKDKGEVAPATCPNCHNQVFLHQLHSTKQFSLYFIPMGNYSSNEYLACPICKAGMQVAKELLATVQRMRAATSVYRRGGVDQNQYLAEVAQFW